MRCHWNKRNGPTTNSMLWNMKNLQASEILNALLTAPFDMASPGCYNWFQLFVCEVRVLRDNCSQHN